MLLYLQHGVEVERKMPTKIEKDEVDQRNKEHQDFIDSHKQNTSQPKPPDERPAVQTAIQARRKQGLGAWMADIGVD
jgi:hypothetical protein